MKIILFLFSILILTSCQDSLNFYRNNKLDVKRVDDLKTGKKKNFTVNKLANGCMKVDFFKDQISYTYCKEFTYNYNEGKKSDSIFVESKSYNSIIDDLNFELLEVRRFNSAGNLLSFDKSIKDLFPTTNSFLNIPLQKISYSDEKVVDDITFNYKNSVRNVLIHALRIYFYNIGNKIINPSTLTDYSIYNITIENRQMRFDLKNSNNKIGANLNISKTIRDENLSLSITKFFEHDQWEISFTKNDIDYTVTIDDSSGQTFLKSVE